MTELADALARNRTTLERLFAACPVPLILTDRASGRVLRMSDSCADLLGTSQPPTTLHQFYTRPGEPDGLIAALEEGAGEAEYETSANLPAGADRTLLIKAAALDVDGRAVVMSGLLDISERKATQTSLEHLASTDALTGLKNRLSFFAAARAEMLRAARNQTMLALPDDRHRSLQADQRHPRSSGGRRDAARVRRTLQRSAGTARGDRTAGRRRVRRVAASDRHPGCGARR